MDIYKEGKQYKNKPQLKLFIHKPWNSIDDDVIKKLISGMVNRIFNLIKWGGGINIIESLMNFIFICFEA